MRTFGYLVCLGALLFAVGCGDEETGPVDPGPPDPEFLVADSPENVVHNLQVALVGRKVSEYDSMLTRDYEFFFNPDDVSNDTLEIPVSWGIADEMRSIRSLLQHAGVEEIKLDWSPGPIDIAEVEGSDATVTLSNVFIEITTRLTTGEPLFTQAQGQFKLHFREMAWNTESGKRAWKVMRWDDQTLPLMGTGQGDKSVTQQSTWGQIKSSYK